MIFVAPRDCAPHPASGWIGFPHQHASLIVALVICLFLSWLSAKIGMAAIIGAFFAGLMFADYAPAVEPAAAGRAGLLNSWRRIFFFSIGSQLNVHLFSGHVLVTASMISAAGDRLQGTRLRIAAVE